MREVDGVAIIIPAHDEMDRLAASIRSAHRALGHIGGEIPRTVVVVLDHCADGSAAVARQTIGVEDLIVEVDARNVGCARALGTEAALGYLADRGVAAPRTWLGHTDADSTLPRWWMARQLRWARRVDAVAGTIRVDDWSDHPPGTRHRFAGTYRGDTVRAALSLGPHPHVHGASLGIRGDAYLQAGGFPPLTSGEDHALWRQVRAIERPVLATRRLWVTTSGRRTGRAPDGFADVLRSLSATPEPG